MADIWGINVLKGRGPDTNIRQSKNVGEIKLSIQISHLSINFEKKTNGFCDNNEF